MGNEKFKPSDLLAEMDPQFRLGYAAKRDEDRPIVKDLCVALSRFMSPDNRPEDLVIEALAAIKAALESGFQVELPTLRPPDADSHHTYHWLRQSDGTHFIAYWIPRGGYKGGACWRWLEPSGDSNGYSGDRQVSGADRAYQDGLRWVSAVEPPL